MEIEIKEYAEQPRKLEGQELEPPKFEKAEQTGDLDAPPKLERAGIKLGETNDERYARHRLERADNKIQAKNRAKEYAEEVEKAERKKQEYREKLYGK